MIVELKHPLVSHHLAALRDKATPPHIFREQVRRLSLLLAYEATAKLPLRPVDIETPMEKMECMQLACRLGLVPILRAGLGMSGAVHDLIPQAEVWHLGFYRDEATHQPVEYYQKFSSSPPPIAFVLDPMLATGGSACEGVAMVKEWGVQTISLLCIIAAPEGMAKVQATHPDVDIFTCAVDEHLNENAYIVPGLGDAGDRIFNTL
ncbi:uracil phosphoribosyltransferase [Pontiella sulfatireligans]|uniref:Uracil phosphoribosyltransferase n=1 Tax=Pontiella sulfatireligans TaxID=2750658 RepID=A0A6C2UIT4_9BACT|nr:uracil phosphoribosyltransferase [Pontiella sulfatireligans]VGO20125.1 Uracil phosphoribosyltransferase [Pontiella sulfatireligans]